MGTMKFKFLGLAKKEVVSATLFLLYGICNYSSSGFITRRGQLSVNLRR